MSKSRTDVTMDDGSVKGPVKDQRRTVEVGSGDPVRRVPLRELGWTPVVVEAARRNLDLMRWLEFNLGEVETLLAKSGAVLFRGFEVGGIGDFEALMTTVCGGKLGRYVHGSTPRTRLSGSVYTATEYPAHMTIPLHNEMSYTRLWPMRLGFFCIQAADAGGETPLADSRRVYARIDPWVRRRFEDRGVMYIRRYRRGVDVSWEQAFETTDRTQVDRYCHANGIDLEWVGEENLCTRHVCQAVAVHPETGDKVWFNQAHLFHPSSLWPELRRTLLELYGPDAGPRDARYGDGSEIEPEALENIREAYRKETVTFPWIDKDVLLVDNMMVAHARNPYRGARQVAVAMGAKRSGDLDRTTT